MSKDHQYYNIPNDMGESGGGEVQSRRAGGAGTRPTLFRLRGGQNCLRESIGGEGTALVVGRDQLNESPDFMGMTSRLQKNHFGTAEL